MMPRQRRSHDSRDRDVG